MIMRDGIKVDGIVDDVDNDSIGVWPKLNATSLLLLQAKLQALVNRGQGSNVSVDDAMALYYDFTAMSGFPEVLECGLNAYTLVPMTGNMYLYHKHSGGANHYARMYKRKDEYITIAKRNGDFYRVESSVNLTQIDNVRFNVLK